MLFRYKGGLEFDGTELPAKVTIFGIKFVEGVETEVTPAQFRERAAYEHAIGKLKNHQQFELVENEEKDAPKAKGWPKGKPRKIKDDAETIEPDEEAAA